jgi:hypothetical protein
MALVMIVMGIVYTIMRTSAVAYDLESRQTERGLSALNAVDTMAAEISRTGYGMGSDVERLYPGLSSSGPTSDALTVRSNPDGVVGRLLEDLRSDGRPVRVDGAEKFRPGDLVMLVDSPGRHERARVASVDGETLSLRSPEDDGSVLQPHPAHTTRVIKIREVRLHLEVDGLGDTVLIEEIDGSSGLPRRVLARHVEMLRFDYLDDAWDQVPPVAVRFWRPLAGVRMTVRLAGEPSRSRPMGALSYSLFAPIEPQTDTVSFDSPSYGFRIRRLFHDMVNPVGVASQPFIETGAILAQSPIGTTTLYTFPLERPAGDIRIDGLVSLPAISHPVALVSPPASSPWTGSLLVVAQTGRRTQVWRTSADATGGSDSQAELEWDTDAMPSVGGAALGPDDALYLSDPTGGAVDRVDLNASDGREAEMQPVGSIDGEPGPMTLGTNGSLYVASDFPNQARTELWEIGFDAEDRFETPRRVAELGGSPLSLVTDPLTGALFALQRDPGGDSVLLEASRWWLQHPDEAPREAFRLSDFKRYSETTLPSPGEVRIPPAGFPPALDVAAFDVLGRIYLGCAQTALMIQADLDRPGGVARIRFGLAGIVGETPLSGQLTARIHAWKRPRFGF